MAKKPTAPDLPVFNLEDVVVKRTKPEELGSVVGITYRPGGCIEYLVSWADSTDEQKHYSFELRLEEDKFKLNDS